MAIFNNNLDMYISLVQTDEILESHFEKHQRQRREMISRLAISTGTIAATTFFAVHSNTSELLMLNFSSLILVNSAFNVYNLYQSSKLNKALHHKNLDEVSHEELSKIVRERKRYEGKLEYISPSRFYRENAQDIEKHFGYESDNNLPVNFLPKEEVPNQIFDEYDMFNQKYELPELKITEEKLTIFIDKLEEWLKPKLLSHRIYYYTSEYFKYLLAKGIVNSWSELTVDTLTTYLEYFDYLEYTKEEIEQFRAHLIQAYKENANNKKLIK